MDTLSLDDLVLAFRTLTLPKSGWTHRAHLRVGAWHVHHFGAEAALAMLRTASAGSETADPGRITRDVMVRRCSGTSMSSFWQEGQRHLRPSRSFQAIRERLAGGAIAG